MKCVERTGRVENIADVVVAKDQSTTPLARGRALRAAKRSGAKTEQGGSDLGRDTKEVFCSRSERGTKELCSLRSVPAQVSGQDRGRWALARERLRSRTQSAVRLL